MANKKFMYFIPNAYLLCKLWQNKCDEKSYEKSVQKAIGNENKTTFS